VVKKLILFSTLVFIVYFGKSFAQASMKRTKEISSKNKKVKILFVAELLEGHFEHRKAEYIKSLKILKEMGYEPYIVETNTKGSSFLDEYSSNVCYPSVNIQNPSRALNEAVSILSALDHFDFDDSDMIIKLNGRYRFVSDIFIRLFQERPDFGIVVRKDPVRGGVFTGCFAMKFKDFKKMLLNYILESYEDKKRLDKLGIERWLAEHVCKLHEKGLSVKQIRKIGLQINREHNLSIY